MSQKLSVVVQIDLEGAYCRLAVTGCLTETNQHALHPLVRRARALPIGGRVIVDLTATRLVDGTALDLLREAIGNDDGAHRGGPVQFLTPHEVPAEPAPLAGGNVRRIHPGPRPAARRPALAMLETTGEVA